MRSLGGKQNVASTDVVGLGRAIARMDAEGGAAREGENR